MSTISSASSNVQHGLEPGTIPASNDIDPQALHDRVMAAYEALGYPHHIVGSWAISDNDVGDFVRHATAADPRKILEVGTFVGVSTMLLALACPKARIVTVDPDLPLSAEMSSAGSSIEGVDHDATTFAIARRVAADLGVLERIRFVRGGFAVGDTFSSLLRKDGETIEVVGPALCEEEGPFDFAFVDGLHSAEAVEADLDLAAAAVTENAPIVLHDCIGFWGANVRSGVYEFLRTRPDYFFSHPRYAHVYRSVGVVRRRGDGRAVPGLVRKPFNAGAVSPLLAQALARLTAAMVGPRPIVELCFGAALLEEAYADETYSWLRLGGRQRHAAAAGKQVAAFADALGEANGAAVFSAELLDFAPEPLLASIIEIALERDAPLVLASTPPGEEGVAGPHSRPLAAVVDLVERAGGLVYAQPALDIESERYALLPEARQLGETSLFATFIVVARPGGFTDARGRRLLPLSAEAGAEREQLELQRTHLTAGYRRYYDDWMQVVAANDWAAERIRLLEGDLHNAQQQLDEARTNLRAAVESQAATAAEVGGFAARFAEIAASLVEFERQRAEATNGIAALSRELEIERASVAAHAAQLEQAEAARAAQATQLEQAVATHAAQVAQLQLAEARHAAWAADTEAQHAARALAHERERATLAKQLDLARAQHASLLAVAIDVFEAMDVLDSGMEHQVKALASLGFEGAPPGARTRHEDDPDLLDVDKVATELALMRANAKWIAEQTLEESAMLQKARVENDALRTDNAALREAVRQIHASTSWRLTAPVRALRSSPGRLPNLSAHLKRLVRAKVRGRKLVAIQSELNRELAPKGVDAVVFDADWYARFYGDVPVEKALQHYLMFGEDEGRWPHRKFDPNFYRAQYPDVSGRNVSPLLHFMKFGLREGRSPSEALHPLQHKASAAHLSPLEYYAKA